jgi:multiple sugar transport system substrate-binding protein
MTLQRRHLLLATAASVAGAPAAEVGAASRSSSSSGATSANGSSAADSTGCPALAGVQGEINLVGNSLPVVQHLAQQAQACAHTGLKVTFKITPQARQETERAFAAPARAPFDAAVVSSAVFSGLYSRSQLLPLTSYVNRLGPGLEERMLVRMDGEVMAIAFMQNTQNFVYRQDLFARHGLAVPTTHAQLLQAAAVLRSREPGLEFPLAMGFAKGFDVAVEFTNTLASLGGRFFEPGSAQPAFQGALGVQALQAMQALMAYMTPNALSSNTDDVMNQLQQGRAAMGVLWATRAARLDDAQASKVVGQMAFAAAPAVLAGGRPAAHLWWDGVVLPRTLAGGAARRDAVFQLVTHLLRPASVQAGNDLATWVHSAYRPNRFGTGVALAQTAGAPAWPGEPFFALAHGELGKALPDALKGERPVAAVLQAAAAAYVRVAAEKGFITQRVAARKHAIPRTRFGVNANSLSTA